MSFKKSPIQRVLDPLLTDYGIELWMKRDDLIDVNVSGNKWRKLKYVFQQVKDQNHSTILSFGGAYSNHIAALAYACKKFGLKSIGVIRGEETTPLNATLSFAKECGMTIHYVSREQYRLKTTPTFLKNLSELFGKYYLIPEGGYSVEGLKGCTEILREDKDKFDLVCLPVGTGTTMAGVILADEVCKSFIGFSALKGSDFLEENIKHLINESGFSLPSTVSWRVCYDYHFGGFAKINDELLRFMNSFNQRTGIILDPIYTGKMMFGLYDLLHKGKLKGYNKILAIHTGGLQGIKGMEERLGRKIYSAN